MCLMLIYHIKHKHLATRALKWRSSIMSSSSIPIHLLIKALTGLMRWMTTPSRLLLYSVRQISDNYNNKFIKKRIFNTKSLKLSLTRAMLHAVRKIEPQIMHEGRQSQRDGNLGNGAIRGLHLKFDLIVALGVRGFLYN